MTGENPESTLFVDHIGQNTLDALIYLEESDEATLIRLDELAERGGFVVFEQ